MRARYYHPRLGRFVSADTVVAEPGNPQSLNRFAYVLGNPLRYTDPTGYFTEEEIQSSLKAEYGEYWYYVWMQWQHDEYWMWVLSKADVEWNIWASDLGIIGTFEKEGDRIIIHAAEQGRDYDLWQFQGQGGYMLRGPDNERPYDRFLRQGYAEPIYDYDTKGKPSAEPVGFKHVFWDQTLFGIRRPLLDPANWYNVSSPPNWGPDNALPETVQQILPEWIQWALAVDQDFTRTRVFSGKPDHLMSGGSYWHNFWEPGNCWNICLAGAAQ